MVFKKNQMPWNKWKKLSTEHCKNLSLSHMGKPSFFKGKHHTPEIKEKLRQASLRQVHRKHRPESIEKMRQIHLGGKSPLWKGGRWITPKGYVRLTKRGYPNTTSQGHIFEHRFVMSEHLGRPLLPNEQIHHINGIKTDNRIENLKIVTSNQEHWKHHIKHYSCTIKNCPKPHQAKGFCRAHYTKHWRRRVKIPSSQS